MNFDGKIVISGSGQGIAEAGGGTDEAVGGVNDGTNVVGSDGAPAAVIGGVVVVTHSTPGREILTPLKPAQVVEDMRSGIGAPDSLNLIGLREALAHRLLRETKQDGVSQVAVTEQTTNNKALERNHLLSRGPWSRGCC